MPFTDLVPQGRLSVAQDVVLDKGFERWNQSPQGRLEIIQEAVLGNFQPSRCSDFWSI